MLRESGRTALTGWLFICDNYRFSRANSICGLILMKLTYEGGGMSSGMIEFKRKVRRLLIGGDMSGHSKWSTIKHKKAATDAKKGRVFSEVSKMIMMAVKEGGSGDPVQNPRLRVALDKAREANMPKDNVQRAIDRGLGKGAGPLTEVLYEGYGPGGVGFLVKVLTDNRNRSGAEVKSIFERHGGSLGGPNSVMFMFERVGDGYRVKMPVQVGGEDEAKVAVLLSKLTEHEDVASVWTSQG